MVKRIKCDFVCSLFVLPFLLTLIYLRRPMAYNREWDKGKDTWADGAQWSGANVRPREDDHFGDGKRRKFNGGVCILLILLLNLITAFYRDIKATMPTQTMRRRPTTALLLHAHPPKILDSHAMLLEDFPRNACSRLIPALMSSFLASIRTLQKLMYDNLPCHLTLFSPFYSQLQAYLSSNGCSVETVTIIRDRSTGTCPFVFPFAHTLT